MENENKEVVEETTEQKVNLESKNTASKQDNKTTNNTMLTPTSPTVVNNSDKPLIKSDIYHTFYLSNNEHSCEPIIALFDFDGDTYYPFVKTKPDANLKAPKFDWTNYVWVDNSATELSTQVVLMKKQFDNINKSISTLNAAHEDSVKDSTATEKKMDELQKMIAASNVQMGQAVNQITQMGAAITQLASAVTKQNSSQNTDMPEQDGSATNESNKEGDK